MVTTTWTPQVGKTMAWPFVEVSEHDFTYCWGPGNHIAIGVGGRGGVSRFVNKIYRAPVGSKHEPTTSQMTIVLLSRHTLLRECVSSTTGGKLAQTGLKPILWAIGNPWEYRPLHSSSISALSQPSYGW